MNKKHLLSFCAILALSFVIVNNIYGDEKSINMQFPGHNGPHNELYPPADMPEAYYDDDNLEIIIVSDGFASYYDVEIFQTEYTIPVISTQIDGYGDSIDISSLSEGSYTIVITSSNNNEFEGTFYIE